MIRAPRLGRRALMLVLAGAVGVAACGDGTAAAKKEPHAAPSSPISTSTSAAAVPTAPLTGLPDPDGVARGRAALSVKIENTPEARPQSGLDQADIVYEEVVEYGITRFWAIFDSAAPATVGPIRSVRALDPNIITPIGGVVAYSGGAPINVDAVRATPVLWVDESNAGAAFFREPTRAAPHNLYGRTAQLWQLGGTPVPPNPVLRYFDPKVTPAYGDPVAAFGVPFDHDYDVSYQWDPAVGWRRFQHGLPFLSPTGEQISATNVIVQFIAGGSEGEGELLGQGDAWIFSRGAVVKGRWSKGSAGQPTRYSDAAGDPVAVAPGRTWVELYPDGYAAPPITPGSPLPTTTTSTTKVRTKVQANKH
jgi:DUF3048 family protein